MFPDASLYLAILLKHVYNTPCRDFHTPRDFHKVDFALALLIREPMIVWVWKLFWYCDCSQLFLMYSLCAWNCNCSVGLMFSPFNTILERYITIFFYETTREKYLWTLNVRQTAIRIRIMICKSTRLLNHSFFNSTPNTSYANNTPTHSHTLQKNTRTGIKLSGEPRRAIIWSTGVQAAVKPQ